MFNRPRIILPFLGLLDHPVIPARSHEVVAEDKVADVKVSLSDVHIEQLETALDLLQEVNNLFTRADPSRRICVVHFRVSGEIGEEAPELFLLLHDLCLVVVHHVFEVHTEVDCLKVLHQLQVVVLYERVARVQHPEQLTGAHFLCEHHVEVLSGHLELVVIILQSNRLHPLRYRQLCFLNHDNRLIMTIQVKMRTKLTRLALLYTVYEPLTNADAQ